MEDVQKRSTYRRAHGLEDENAQGLGGWTAKKDEEMLGTGIRVDGAVGREIKGSNEDGNSQGNNSTVQTGSDSREVSLYADWEGGRKPVKKWFGIW